MGIPIRKMINRNRYAEQILTIIKQTRDTPHWSVSDYLDPIKRLYVNLLPQDKKDFRLSVLALLEGNECLENIFDVCQKLQFHEACPRLMKLLVQPPRLIDRHPVWKDGFRRSVMAALGELKCLKARPFLNRLLTQKMTGKRSGLLQLSVTSYGVAMQALAKIAPEDAAKYFGWWLKREQQLVSKELALVKRTDDWKIMEKAGVTLPIDERESAFAQYCLLTVAKQGGLKYLKQWLARVQLSSISDREHLQYQLERLLTGANPLCDLKSVLRFTGEPHALAHQLALLPSINTKGKQSKK